MNKEQQNDPASSSQFMKLSINSDSFQSDLISYGGVIQTGDSEKIPNDPKIDNFLSKGFFQLAEL